MATQVGTAYVQIMPSAKGIKGAIGHVLDPEARSAGEKSGSSLGSSLVKKAVSVLAA